MRTYRRLTLVFLFLVAAVYFFISLALPDESFWITDAGNKFIVMRNMELFGSDNIVYPAFEIDPEKNFLPDSDYHLNKTPDGVYSIFPSYFPAVSLPFHLMFGYAGLYLLPFISSLLIYFYMDRIARHTGLPNWQGGIILVAAFCSPLLFYSFTFWEMTPAIALSTISIYYLVSKRAKEKMPVYYFIAGVFLGLSTILREEGYFLLAAFVLAMLLTRHSKFITGLYAGGFMTIILPLWVFQFIRYGHILGLHGAGYHSHNAGSEGLVAIVSRQLEGYWFYLFKFNSWSIQDHWLYFLPAIPFAAAVFLGASYGEYEERLNRVRLLTLAGCCLAELALVVGMFTGYHKVINCIFMVGLLPGVPYLVMIALGIRPLFKRLIRGSYLMLLASGLYILMICPILTRTDMGIIWGPRHFMLLLPMLIPLSFAAIRGFTRHCPSFFLRQAYRLIFVFLCLCGFAIQVRGLYNLKVMKDNSLELAREIEKRSDTYIISDVYWMPFMTPKLYHERKFLQVKNDREFAAAIETLRRNRVKNFTYLRAVDPGYRAVTGKTLKKYLGPEVKILTPTGVKLPGTEFLELIIVRCHFPDKD